MVTLIQRAGETVLSVDGEEISRIPSGLVAYVGIREGDGKEQADKTARRIAGLRVFPDADGKMNLSLKEAGGEVLLVSQFTLCGDLSHGMRPNFSSAERPEKAEPLYEYLAQKIRECGITVKTGIFGADMKICQYNDGPVAVIYEV